MKTTWAKALDRALARLVQSNGRVIARRNARREIARVLREIGAHVEVEYPMLRRDGTSVERKKQRGVRCPACDVPMKSFAALAAHAGKKHGRNLTLSGDRMKCWCGRAFIGMSKMRKDGRKTRFCSGKRQFIRHLAAQRDLKVHVQMGALVASARGDIVEVALNKEPPF